MRPRPDLWLRAGMFGVLAALAASSVTPAAHATNPAASQSQTLDGDVVPGTAQAGHLGELPRSAYLRLAFTLVPRNPTALDGFVTEVEDPVSPHYRRYLHGSEFADRYGRTTQEINRLRAFLKGNGFHIDDVHPGRLVVDASGTAADVERTLGIRLDTWRDRVTGRVFYGNATPPQLPADLGSLVADIAGLNDRAVRVPAVRLGRAGGPTSAEVLAANGVTSVAPGQDSGPKPRVGLVEFAGYRPQDVAEFDRRFAPASPMPQLRLVDGGPEDGRVDQEAAAAEIETVQVTAPTAVPVVFAAENSPAGEIDALQGLVDAGMTVGMTGWGSSEEQRTGSGMRAIDLVLEEGVSEGIGFYAAAVQPGPHTSDDADPGAEFPASDPYLTAVGVADDTGSDSRVGGRTGSTVFAQPWWQARWGGVDPRGRRQVPDLTARVVPGMPVFTGGRWRRAGGAGVATALATGLAARADQHASSCGQSSPGFTAPVLYRAAHEEEPVSGAVPDRGLPLARVARTLTALSCQKGRRR